MNRTERCVRSSFAALCAWEAVAVATGRMPTVSMLCRRRRLVEIGLLIFLLVHLHRVSATMEELQPDATESGESRGQR